MTSSRRSVSPLCYFHDPIERPREFGVSKRDNRRYLGKAGAFQNEGVHIYVSSVSNCKGYCSRSSSILVSRSSLKVLLVCEPLIESILTALLLDLSTKRRMSSSKESRELGAICFQFFCAFDCLL